MLLALALLLLQTPSPVQALSAAETTHNAAQAQSALIQLADSLPNANPQATQAALPYLLAAIADRDAQTRTLGMLALIAIPPANHPQLNPHAATIAEHLNDPEPSVRSLAVLALGAFTPHPPAAVIPALLKTLASSDAMLGSAIVPALLALDVDVHAESASAILHFLARPGLPVNTVAKLISTIAHARNHSATLDPGLLVYLAPSHPEPVRTALVSALPMLRLSAAELTATRAQLTRLTEDAHEPAGLKSVASGILPCWHQARMADPCPALSMRYRMVPAPKDGLPKPRYQSPPIRKDSSL